MIINCAMCWIEIDNKNWIRKYCSKCRSIKDHQLAKQYEADRKKNNPPKKKGRKKKVF